MLFSQTPRSGWRYAETESGTNIETEKVLIDSLEIGEDFLDLIYHVVHISFCELLNPLVLHSVGKVYTCISVSVLDLIHLHRLYEEKIGLFSCAQILATFSSVHLVKNMAFRCISFSVGILSIMSMKKTSF